MSRWRKTDTTSWLLALADAAPLLGVGFVGFFYSWLGLRILDPQLDHDVALFIYSAGGSSLLTWVAIAVSDLGDDAWMVLVFGLYVFRKDKHDWTSALILGVAVAMSVASSEILKHFIDLGRPYQLYPSQFVSRGSLADETSAFPSTTTALAVTVAAVLWARHRAWRIPGIILGVGTGLALIVTGGHFPSDIIAGTFLGIGSATFALSLEKLHSKKQEKGANVQLACAGP